MTVTGKKASEKNDGKMSRKCFSPNRFETWRMKNSKKGDASWVWLLPVLLFSMTILIVRLVTVSRNLETYEWLSVGTDADGNIYDFFAYAKMEVIMFLAVLAVIFLICRVTVGELFIRKTVIYIPLGIYAVLDVISYAFSDNKEIASFGYIERYEGTFVVLAYLLILFYVINCVDSERDVKWIAALYSVVLGILSVLGLSQMLGHDFFKTDIGRCLIVPKKFESLRNGLEFTFENNEAYQTVYNINYVSFYMTLAIPFIVLLFLYMFNSRFGSIQKKDKEDRTKGDYLAVAGALLLLAGLVINLAGSQSIGGFVGLGAGLIAAVVLLNRRLLKWWKPMIAVCLAVAVPLGALHSLWFDQVSEIAGGAVGAVTPTAEAATYPVEPGTSANTQVPYIDYFETSEDALSMSVNGNPIRFTFSEKAENAEYPNFNAVTITDGQNEILRSVQVGEDGTVTENGLESSENGTVRATDQSTSNIDFNKVISGEEPDIQKLISQSETHVTYAVDDSRYFPYMKYSFVKEGYGAMFFVLNTCGHNWVFLIVDQVGYLNGSTYAAMDLTKVESAGFENNQSFGNGRGYIWSRCIPMMQKSWLIGYGADTFAINFPQQDCAGKYNSGAFSDMVDIVVDKPHNLYMDIWIGTGGLSCMAFLLMVLIYLVQAVMVLRGRTYESLLEYAAAGIFIGVIGFMTAGLVNDSSVSVMPMFYVLLGTGIAINFILGKNTKNV